MIVSDVNLIAYTLIQGGQSKLSESVRLKDPEWAAPFLWRSEFRNVLTLYVWHHQMPIDHAQRLVLEAEAMMKNLEYSVASEKVLELAGQTKLSAYDAEYVVLAAELKIQLITSDRQLLQEAPTVAVHPQDFVHS